MIQHPDIDVPMPTRAFVFAHLPNISISICAPDDWTADEVADFANALLPQETGAWATVDKSKLGLGTPTPNPCNQAPARRHWFLLSGLMRVGA